MKKSPLYFLTGFLFIAFTQAALQASSIKLSSTKITSSKSSTHSTQPPSTKTTTYTTPSSTYTTSSSCPTAKLPSGVTPFTLIASRSGSPIDHQPIQAYYEQIYIGLGPKQYCVQGCPCLAGTTTTYYVNSTGFLFLVCHYHPRLSVPVER